FLSSKLRRFTASEAELHADPAVTALVSDVYAAILDLVKDPYDSATLGRLDALRARFEDAAATFDPVVREQADAVRASEAEVEALERALQERDDVLRRKDETARTSAAEIDR